MQMTKHLESMETTVRSLATLLEKSHERGSETEEVRRRIEKLKSLQIVFDLHRETAPLNSTARNSMLAFLSEERAALLTELSRQTSQRYATGE